MKKELKNEKTKMKEAKDIVKEVIEDFKKRAEERKSFDLIWQINMNF